MLDTWEMTVEALPGTHTRRVLVPLPGKPYMAIRVVRVDPPAKVEPPVQVKQ